MESPLILALLTKQEEILLTYGMDLVTGSLMVSISYRIDINKVVINGPFLIQKEGPEGLERKTFRK